MNLQHVAISKLRGNSKNPRIIKDQKFQKLVQSIKDFPEMLALRPIVVDADYTVLGGNMRLKACQAAGLKEVPIVVASDLTPDQQQEFIVKDNASFGEWDWDALANHWDTETLADWGVDVPTFANDEIAAEDVKPSIDNIVYKVVVECAGQYQQAALVEELEQRGFVCQLLTL
jgi:ParB-like chromosome segregation protein Spo0J